MGGDDILTLTRIEALLDLQVAKFFEGQPNRGRLLDIATVLSFSAHTLSTVAHRFGETPETEPQAGRARDALQFVQDSIRWLQRNGQTATENEVCEHVLAANLDAMRAVYLLKRMGTRHIELVMRKDG